MNYILSIKIKYIKSTTQNIHITDSYLCHSNQLILECKVHGTPSPTITWFKNSREIHENERYSLIEHRDGIRQLVIMHPIIGENATYTCRAKNSVDELEISHVVCIPEEENQIPPSKADGDKIDLDAFKTKLRFEMSLKNITVEQGKTAKFICSVKGSISDRNVIWLKDGKTIDFIGSGKYHNSFKDGLIILEVFRPQPSDSGEYTCLINKGTNEVTTTSKLYVYQSSSNGDDNVPVSFSRSLKGLKFLNISII